MNAIASCLLGTDCRLGIVPCHLSRSRVGSSVIGIMWASLARHLPILVIECNRGVEMDHPRRKQLIEIGWIIVGRMDPTDREALSQAKAEFIASLGRLFAEFTWRLPIIQREEWGQRYRAEPAALLEYGMIERDMRHWDFVFIVTDRDLVSHYKPYALGALSRSVSTGIISTARLDPQSIHTAATEAERLAVMTRRISALSFHLFGHLNGLAHHPCTENYMYDVEAARDLDHMGRFVDDQVRQLEANLYEVGDLRLEEEATSVRIHPLRFYSRGAWRGRADIARAILQAKPWEFPFRLNRLTTAAISSLLIFLITAEVWDLGMSQPTSRVIALAVTALIITTFYILRRQRLLMRRETSGLSEQTVTTNISVTAVVALGMLTTYSLLLLAALGLSALFFQHQLVSAWASSLEGHITSVHYVILAAFVASLGLLIGALGASFEQQHYFRHVTYIDEET